MTLEKLLADGRIHPARIEETYYQAKSELEDHIVEMGEQAVLEARVEALDPELVKLLGRLRFRTSYGQNVLAHIVECANLAAMMAAELGASVKTARRAALLHDIGKLAVSNRILDKPARLTGAELAQVREHPLITERVLRRVPGLERLAPVAGAHHERLDGSGYPRGLPASQLTPPMRVLAVADVYEALTSRRPYRDAFSSDRALAVIRDEVPARFDRESFAVLEGLLNTDDRELLGSDEPARRADTVFNLGHE
jgi:putative nucleotidyltransferase with HDIG domain